MLKQHTSESSLNWHGLTWIGGTFESDTGGTFHSDMPGTFQSAADGTFVSAIDGTFQSDMSGTFGPLLSIQDYSVKDSTLYIRCMTDQGIETYRLDKGELFCKAEKINNANWRTHLIENYKIFTFIRIMSILIFLIGISLYGFGLRRR